MKVVRNDGLAEHANSCNNVQYIVEMTKPKA